MAKAIGYMEPDIDPNTRLYVPFNEGIGNVAKDYSQYGNHAQLTDVEWSPTGFNGAGKFNGSSSFGDCGNDASLNINDVITIKTWIKTSVDARFTIVGKYHREYEFLLMESGRGFSFLYGDGSSYSAIEISYGSYNVFDNIWHHIVFAGDKSIGIFKVYVDGAYFGTDSDPPLAGSGSYDFNIGRRSGDAQYFNGTINEVRIYALALSAAQNVADCYEVVCS